MFFYVESIKRLGLRNLTNLSKQNLRRSRNLKGHRTIRGYNYIPRPYSFRPNCGTTKVAWGAEWDAVMLFRTKTAKKELFLYEGKFYTLREYPLINLAKQFKKSFSTNVVFRPLCAEISVDTKSAENLPEFVHFLAQIVWLCDGKIRKIFPRGLICLIHRQKNMGVHNKFCRFFHDFSQKVFFMQKN